MSGVNSILDSSDRNELLESLMFKMIEYDKNIGSLKIIIKEQANPEGLSILGNRINPFKISEQRRIKLRNFIEKLTKLDEEIISLDTNKIISFSIQNHNSGSGYDRPYRMAGYRSEKLVLKINIKNKRNDNLWSDIDMNQITNNEKIEIIDAIMKVLKLIEKKGIGEDIETLIDNTETATDRLIKKFRRDQGII